MTALATGVATGLTTGLEVRSVRLDDPLASVLLDELFHEYSTRYPENHPRSHEAFAAFRRQGADEFVAPHGDLLLLLAGGEAVAGGAIRRRTEPELGDPRRRAPGHPGSHDAHEVPLVPTGELKRIWTHSAHRREGYARRLVAELEARARGLGYERLYLTTGPRQPEAVGLYVATGYTPLFDPVAVAASGELGPRPFEKWL